MFPLLIPILAAGTLRVLRERGYAGGRIYALLAGLVTLAAFVVVGGGSFTLSFWRPVELFGDGLAFRIDAAVLPLAVVAAALAGRQRLEGSPTELRLLHLTATLAAISADNLLTVTISWSVLALWGNWSGRNIWLLSSVAPLFAAAAFSADPASSSLTALFIALGALLLSRGADRPYLLALPAFALLSRQPLVDPGLVLIGAGAVVVATLGGRRWLAAGLVGFGLLSAGLQPGLAGETLLAGALTLVVVGNLEWAPAGSRRWIGGLLVGGLPLQVALTGGGQSPSLLTMPAAALLAAPILGGAAPQPDRALPDWPGRLVVAVPSLVCAGVLVWSVDQMAFGAAVYGLGAIVLALLMAAGPRWLYRQSAYTRVAGSALQVAGEGLAALLEGLTATVRAANRVLEGESSTVWLLVILLVLVQTLGG